MAIFDQFGYLRYLEDFNLVKQFCVGPLTLGIRICDSQVLRELRQKDER